MGILETSIAASLVLTRLTAMLLTAPLLGSRHVPIRFRLLLGLLLTALTVPLLMSRGFELPSRSQWLAGLVSEVAVGISLGLGVMLVYSAAQMAGSVIARMAAFPVDSGLAMDESGSPVGQLFGAVSAAAFTLINGPEMLITTTIDTFATLPLGTSLDTAGLTGLLIELLRQSFLLTLRGVAPAVTAMLIATIVMGMIGRTYPQLNLLPVSLTSNLAVMLLAIFFTLGGCVWLFMDDLQQVTAWIESAMTDHQLGAAASQSPSRMPLGQPFPDPGPLP